MLCIHPPLFLQGISGIVANPDDFDETRTARRPGKRLTEAEQWEAKQLIASGVLTVEE
jgi:ATP-dependent RNA helicase DHX8/PRP22